MADQALYRKYRSSDFSQVIGQDHVVQTLTAAIASGKFVHAYLFTGPRGTGKTSVARLLARALNCIGEPKPCNKCAPCTAAINSSLDVVEIDAASNRSIDAVRDLREKVALAPTHSKYKVYIIDEVHMLTTEAFNALLKTLEEPPAHAIFVLATTEVHKVPETIISRTQRFNFRPISNQDLVGHLANIASLEKITIDSEALSIIASASRGGFRDAISLLDQLAVGTGANITASDVRRLLGYSSHEEVVEISRAIQEADAKTALISLERLAASGAQPAQVVTQLVDFWRLVMLTATGLALDADPAIAELAVSSGATKAGLIIEELLPVTKASWPLLSLEAAIVRLSATDAPQDTPRRLASTAPKSAPMLTPSAKPQPVAQSTSSGTLDAALWPKVLVTIKAINNSLSALLQMYPVELTDTEVTVKPRFNFHRDIFLKPTNRTTIEAAATKVYGRSVKVNARTEESETKPSPKRSDPNSELVASALEILGGEVVD